MELCSSHHRFGADGRHGAAAGMAPHRSASSSRRSSPAPRLDARDLDFRRWSPSAVKLRIGHSASRGEERSGNGRISEGFVLAVGVDLSADLVGRARERAEGMPEVEFRVGIEHLASLRAGLGSEAVERAPPRHAEAATTRPIQLRAATPSGCACLTLDAPSCLLPGWLRSGR
jgi:hypothetical protein